MAAGCRDFAVHARRAWLGGLSPARNRTRPPLDYEAVRQAARLFPEARFVLNGGLGGGEEGLGGAMRQARDLAGVMVGRAIWERPRRLFAADALAERHGGLSVPAAEAASETVLAERMLARLGEEAERGEETEGAEGAERPVGAGGRGGRGRAAARCLRACTRLFAGRRGAGAWRAALAAAERAALAGGRPAPPRRGGPTPDRRGDRRRRRRPRSRRGRLRPRRCLERRSAGGTGRPRLGRPRLWRCRPILVRMRPERGTALAKVSACATALRPIPASITSQVSSGAPSRALATARAVLASSSIKPALMWSRPALSRMTGSKPCACPARTPSKARAAGSAPEGAARTGQPILPPHADS